MKAPFLILAIFVFPLLLSCKSSKTVLEKSDMNDVIALSQADSAPMFNGKAYDEGFYEYLYQNIKYPIEAMQRGISGIVIVQFVIEKDGSVSNVKVSKSAHILLDNEAIRLIKRSPKWTPGIKADELVRVMIDIHVTFRLSGVYNLQS